MARETLLTREGYERKKAELEAKERRLYQEIPALLAQAKDCLLYTSPSPRD